MPSAVFVPAQLNDLSVDVAVGSPARGAVLYRGAAKWNALAAGTAGQLLTSGGAGADPSWTTLSSTFAGLTDVSVPGAAQGAVLYRGASAFNALAAGTSGQYLTSGGASANPVWATLPTMLSGDVILAPGSSARNVVQPTGDFTALTLKANGSQSNANPIAAWYNSGGTLVSEAAYDGALRVANSKFFMARSDVGAPTYDPASLPTGYMTFNFSSAGMVEVTNGTGSPLPLSASSFSSAANGNTRIGVGVETFNSNGYDPALGLLLVGCATISGAPPTYYVNTLDTFTTVPDANGLLGVRNLGSAVWELSGAGDMTFRRTSSTTAGRAAADCTVTWATATDATRKARLVLNVWDTAAREALRLEASGSAPMIGFLGGSAVVQQANASQADVTAVTDTHAKAALQAIYTLLVNYGLAHATA